MRLRSAAVAAAGTLVLLIGLPTSAHADVSGEFSYKYLSEDGPRTATLLNPPDGECINLFDASGSLSVIGFAPANNTDSLAQVFEGEDCHTLREYEYLEPGQTASDELQIESVVFPRRV